MGAPAGNRNAARAREFRDALDWALKNYEAGAVKRGKALRAVAASLVRNAIAGESWAIKEVADRLDGKAIAAAEVSGPEGGPIVVAADLSPMLTRDEWLIAHGMLPIGDKVPAK